MKNIMTLFIVSMLYVNCNNVKTYQSDYKIEIIKTYNPGNIITFEEIDVAKLDSINFIKFIYDYKKLQQENDILLITPGSITFNNIKMDYISERNYVINNEHFLVKKYLYEGRYSSSDVYINQKQGLLIRNITNSTSTKIIEYDKKMDKLNKQIISDSTFFNYD